MRSIMSRLSHGERDAGDGGRQYLRDLFLSRVSEVPGLIESLLPGLELPLYFGRFHFVESKAVREFLAQWSRDHNLDADWIRERVFEKLCFWKYEIEKYRIYDLGVGVGSANTLSPPEGLPSYYAANMKRTDYLGMVKSLVTLKLSEDPLLKLGDSEILIDSILQYATAYCDAAERMHKRSRIKPELNRDLKWTVEFQVVKRDQQEIATAYLPGVKGATDVVRKAITDILKRIGLPRRVASRGRKKGSKNKYSLSNLGKGI
jgi:hypothetical protein